MASREEMSVSFGQQAATYQQGRPDYPVDAVAWMLEPVAGETVRVADVGAGTGKLTAAVLAAGATEVVAVDPDPAMLTQLREGVDVETFEGKAEALPLPDASQDAVVLGQAWHWVDPVAGSREVGRVVRPGGVLGLIWNTRDGSVPWVRRLTEIMHSSAAEVMIEADEVVVADPFGAPEKREWRWTRPMTREQLFAMARSRSYLITAPAEELAEIERGLGELFDEIGAVGDARIDMPYVTAAFRSIRS